MKLTLEEISAIQSLEPTINNLTLSAATAYKLTKLFTIVKAEYTSYTDALKTLLEKYAERDENNQFVITGDGVKIKTENIEVANKELEDLSNVTINIDTTFTLDELDKLPLTFAQFKIFSKLIAE